ncbi:MAG: rRNA pseudouridine synthase [Chloroflexi bacterium]|nr:rRNA pseudouridine synthase [Chloroflexota bacterium]
MEERLQKILAQHEYGSRRSCEDYIRQRRVKVNGKVIELGAKADPDVDVIEVDGKVLPRKVPQMIYIALNKPRGVLSDLNDNDSRPNVMDLIPIKEQLFPVGRLDLNSEGLMLLTNDGDLANRLTHPRYGHEKEYQVLVGKRPDAEQLAIWRRGVVMEDGYRTLPASVEVEHAAGDHTWLKIIMKEGKKRQIREIGSRIGLPVLRIIRVRLGSLQLGNLKPKEWRYLTPREVQQLKTYKVEKIIHKPVKRG